MAEMRLQLQEVRIFTAVSRALQPKGFLRTLIRAPPGPLFLQYPTFQIHASLRHQLSIQLTCSLDSHKLLSSRHAVRSGVGAVRRPIDWTPLQGKVIEELHLITIQRGHARQKSKSMIAMTYPGPSTPLSPRADAVYQKSAEESTLWSSITSPPASATSGFRQHNSILIRTCTVQPAPRRQQNYLH